MRYIKTTYNSIFSFHVVRGVVEQADDRILKLENEIKVLKIALNAGNASGGGVDMDSLTQLMNMVNELSDKLKEDC